MLIIDRIEGDFAVCEQDGRAMRTLPLAQLPPGVHEGDCLRETADGYAVDQEETQRRRAANRELLRGLFQREEE